MFLLASSTDFTAASNYSALNISTTLLSFTPYTPHPLFVSALVLTSPHPANPSSLFLCLVLFAGTDSVLLSEGQQLTVKWPLEQREFYSLRMVVSARALSQNMQTHTYSICKQISIKIFTKQRDAGRGQML